MSVACTAATALVAAVVVGSAGGDSQPASTRTTTSSLRTVTVTMRDRVVMELPFRAGSRMDARAVGRALSRRLPATVTASRGSARIVHRYDRQATARRAVALGAAGGSVEAVRRPVSSRMLVPVVRQERRNTCESAALEMLLAAAGGRVSQRRLQAAFPTSGPLDPVGTGPEQVWGDPDRGYVGRPDGGGAAGGFGIYPGPVAATARRLGHSVQDLSRSSPSRIYERVLRGRAVMAWIGLSDGPYGEWRSPADRRVKVNFGEHTVVLIGMTREGRLRVANPLQGTFEVWTRARFEAAWALLGRRALGV